jgi:hypothetical protein
MAPNDTPQKKDKFTNEDRLALYQSFIGQMLTEGYTLDDIGIELAIISHVLLVENER